MALQTVTLQLPEKIYKRLRRMAETTHQPLEDVVFRTIQGNLPPVVDDLPSDMQSELAALQNLNDEALWATAKEALSQKQWQRHQYLLHKNETEQLSEVEREELAHLRNATDQFVLRRSYALALLKWRGYSLPPLNN